MLRDYINKNVDYLYKLHKDETEHQNHRLMWILTAQALIFTALCTLLPKYDTAICLNPVIVTILTLVGILISISGLYSLLVSKTAIGTVYERWNKYNKLSNAEKKKSIHHIISLAPKHIMNSRITWLMFCYFAPNVFCSAWITISLMYLFKKWRITDFVSNHSLMAVIVFFVVLTALLTIFSFLSKLYILQWLNDENNKKRNNNNNDNECKEFSCGLKYGAGDFHGIVYNENGIIQNSFNEYNFCNCSSPLYASAVQIGRNHSTFNSNWEELRIYHIVIDRFNGNISHEKERKDFLGGTIRGIIDKIHYISSMKYNAIMLTPIFKGEAYHGYHTTNYEEIDEHFGTWADFKELINVVHKNNMILICDYVPNHCNINHPFFQAALKDINSPYRPWFYFDNVHKNIYTSFQDIKELPKFNLYNEAASDYLISIAVMLAKMGVDGLRIDHVIGVPFAFLDKLHIKVKEINPNLFLFGEAWLGTSLQNIAQVEFKDAEQKNRAYKNELSQEEIQLNYINYLDGILDFEFSSILIDEVKRIQSTKKGRLLGNEQLKEKIANHFSKYPIGFQLILFLDNHDTNRFLFYCNGDKSLLHEALTLCENTYAKPYSVYYGTEIYMWNRNDILGRDYGDLDVREPMNWN